MSLAESANALSRRIPAVVEQCNYVKRVDSVVAALPWTPFYELVSLIEQDAKGAGRHLNLDASMLEAWAKHISYSMRIRLRGFEPVVLGELLAGNSLAASTALRAHLEAAAMASLCLTSLNEARDTGRLDRVATLITQTLFGTALYGRARKDERVVEMLSFAEQRTITIVTAIDALDSFLYHEAANGSTTILYALLCESAHPNHRGTKPFVSARETDPEGWIVQYSPVETLESATVIGIMDGLSLSMRGGYAASEMLRVAEFDSEKVPYRGCPEDEGQRIWSAFLAPGA